MLVLGSLFVFGNYFNYDYPGSLEDSIKIHFMISSSAYGLLYSGYALPNIVMPFFSGLFFDKFGTRKGLILFSICVCLGAYLFTHGGYTTNFNYLLAGRVIYGIGAEAMYVGQSAIISEWFVNYELPFAMSMISFVPLFGSFSQGALIPHIFV